MTSLTCPDVEAHLDLYAAGECDAATAAAVAHHLAACPDCARAHREAQQVHALLDLRFREGEALQRLRARVQAEPRRQRRTARALPLLRRALAVAALVLIAVGGPMLLAPLEPSAERAVATVVYASPGAQYARSSPGAIDLQQGELWVRVERGRAKDRGVEVRTPGGVATVMGTEFFIAAGKAAVVVTVRDGTVKLANARGAADGRPGEVLRAEAEEAPRRQVEDLALLFGRHYRPVPVRAAPHGPVQTPPFDLSSAEDYQQVAAAFPLQKAAPALERDGFVVVPGPGVEDLSAAYRWLRAQNVPAVITADTLLHLCRAHLDVTLRDVEERVFVAELTGLLRVLIDTLDSAPAPTADERAARSLAMAYLAVALRALEPDAPLPRAVDAAAVAEVVAAMRRHDSGPVRVRLLGRDEDFGAYRPEGHYQRSERLQRYHAAMTWLGRMALLLDGPLVAPEEARRQTRAAVLIARALDQAHLPDGRRARAAWERIETVTAFHVGLSDELGPQQYAEALAQVGGALDEQGMRSFKVELAKAAPAAERRRGAAATSPAGLLDLLEPDAGFRLFGRRFTPDGYMMERLTGRAVGPPTRQGQFTLTHTRDGRALRGLPRGLDVMAVLGSRRARDLLRELGDDGYQGYDRALASLRRRFASFDDVDWNRNLYWSWLYALKALLTEADDGAQPFTASAAYRTRLLNTALASWAHRRQDTVLYARKSKTMLEAKTLKAPALVPAVREAPAPVPYVEPLPELYARLRALVRMGGVGLRTLAVLDAAGEERLARLEKLLQRLQTVAETELAGRPIEPADQALLRNFVDDPEGHAATRDDRRLAQLEKELQAAKLAKDEKRMAAVEKALLAEGEGAMTTVSLATVHTDPNTGQILQEATGLLDLGIFLYRRQDGKLALAAGPVLSYYEFKRPSAAPVTEPAWRLLLKDATPAQRPPWAASYLVSP